MHSITSIHPPPSEVQSDSEVNRAKRGDSDRGYTSDSEVYDGLKPATISSSSSFQALPASDDPAHSTAHSVLNASSSDTLHSAISPRTHPSPNKDSTAAAATDTASADSKARKKSVVKNAFVSDESWFSVGFFAFFSASFSISCSEIFMAFFFNFS